MRYVRLVACVYTCARQCQSSDHFVVGCIECCNALVGHHVPQFNRTILASCSVLLPILGAPHLVDTTGVVIVGRSRSVALQCLNIVHTNLAYAAVRYTTHGLDEVFGQRWSPCDGRCQRARSLRTGETQLTLHCGYPASK